MENNEKELLAGMEARLAAMEEQGKKRSRRVYLAVLVSIVLIIALGIFLVVSVSSLKSELKVFTDFSEAIDMEAVAGKINELAAMDTAGLEKLSNYFAGMDEEDFASRMDGLQEVIEMFSKLDLESFGQALADLNKTLEPLMKLFGGRG